MVQDANLFIMSREVYLESCQTSKIELFAKLVKGSNIFAKSLSLTLSWQRSLSYRH